MSQKRIGELEAKRRAELLQRARYIWMMAGILLAAVFGAMSASGSYQPGQLFNHEYSYEFSKASLSSGTKTCPYDKEAGLFTAQSVAAKKKFSKMPMRQWTYLDFDIRNMNTEYAVFQILYLDQEKRVIASQEAGVVNGMNTVQTACAEEFCYIQIQIMNQPGLSFSLKKVLAHTGPAVSFTDWLAPFIGYLMLYLLISLVWLFAKKGGFSACLELLQYAFMRFGNRGGASRFGEKQKDALRTFLFFLLFSGMIAANAAGIYQTEDGYRYCLVFATLILTGIALLRKEKPLTPVRWRGNVVFFWFLYWGAVCVMDALTDKHFRFTGYACLIGMTFLFYTDGQSKKASPLRRNAVFALSATFALVMLYCVLFRGRRTGALYNGPFTSREDMAIYSVTMLGVFLAVLAKALFDGEKGKRRAFLTRVLALAVAVSLCAHNLYLSFTPMCALAGVILLSVFALVLIQKRKCLEKGLLKTFLILAAAAACSVAVVLPVHAMINRAPRALGTDTKFPGDVLESYVPKSVMKQAERKNPGMYRGVRSIANTEKDLAWRAYLREMSLLGNKARLYVGKHKTMAGSGWLELAYRYGIFILLPFAGLWLALARQAVKTRSYGLCALFFLYQLMLLTQNIEKPFLQPLWILAYLGAGRFFLTERPGSKEGGGPEEISGPEADAGLKDGGGRMLRDGAALKEGGRFARPDSMRAREDLIR